MKISQKLGKLRRSHNARLIFMVILLAILAGFWLFWEKFRLTIGILIITILIALGLEMKGDDWDLGRLAETGSFSESKVSTVDGGEGWLIGNENCQKGNTNCDNFTYQEEAQELFETCGGLTNDLYGLDRDKDGIVCEALKHMPAQ